MKNITRITVIVFLMIGIPGINQSCKKILSPPDLSTLFITDVTQTTAVTRSLIRDDGGAEITARGVCWSTSQNPTTSSNKTEDGTGAGSYFSVMEGLTANTTYYVRAWAVNSEGTNYGNERSFTTSLPTTGIRKFDIPGDTRYGATSFSVGNKVYLVIGFGNDVDSHRDFWEWDQGTNLWAKKADFPGESGSGAVGFSIGIKGYIGTGRNVSGEMTNEFWEYDPATNKWTQKASLPVNASRTEAVGFSIANKGYIGTGYIINSTYMENSNDFWEYDPAADKWTEKSSLPVSAARGGAVGFSIGTKGYIGTGIYVDVLGGYARRDFWEWDQETDTWTRKADFGGSSRGGAVAFSIDGKGYIGTGCAFQDNGITNYARDFWEWDMATNTWTRLPDFEGRGRMDAIGVSIEDKGYIGAGIIEDDWGIGMNDFWEFDPVSLEALSE